MTLNDLKKKYGIGAQAAETKPKSTGLDQLRKKYGISSTTDIVEEAKAKPRLYKNEAEYYAANARPYDEVKAELDAVTKRRNTYDNEKAMRDSGISGRVWQKRYGEKNTERIEELAHLIEMENKRIDSLTREAQYGRLKEYNDLANNEDFDAGSVYDKNAKATVANQLYRQVNNPDLPLTNEEYSDATREITRQMTADEVKIFNYIYNTQGDKAAQEYFDYLKTDAPDPLNSRRGKEIAGNIDTDVGRAIYGGIAAVDNTTQGVKQLFTSEAVKPTVAQYASAQAAEDVETKVGKFAYDLSATVGNMAPSILASTLVGVVNPLLGKAVGSTLMGAASAGNTYTDAINSGMTPRQAMKYGAMVGASEAALESVLGGISKLGANPVGKAAGKLVSGSKFAKAIGAADNAFIRAAAKLAGSMAGEIAEEELQLFLEPLFKTMATDEKYDAPEWEEIVYTALISAATAGLFEAPGNIAEAVQESRQKKIEKILNDAIAEHEKQSEAQSSTDVANADFANKVLDENAQQTANDTAEKKAAETERKDAYSEMVANYADSMDAAGQNVFIEAYDGSVEPDVYVKEMQDAYDAGRRGEELVDSDTLIGDDRRQLAYKAGIADKATADADYGFVHNEVSHTVDRKLVQNLNRIGKGLKVKIQFADSVRGDTANGSYRNGVITISRKAENPYMVVAKHEITHHLKQTAEKSYGAYEAYAVETFAKSLGLSADALVQDMIAEAARSGDRLTAEQAREEIAADFTEAIFTDEKTLRRFVEVHAKSAEGRNMLQRLFDAIRRFIARLGKMDESVLLGMGITREQLEKAERLYREVLAESGQQTAGVSGDGGKVMMSLKKRDTDYLEAVKRGDMDAAQRMVDEAAKAAGYNSPKLYHGTKAFGFTEVKTSGVEKGVEWSPFFATNNPAVATTYSGEAGAKAIGNKKRPQKSIGSLREEAISRLVNTNSYSSGVISDKLDAEYYIEKFGRIMDEETVEMLRNGRRGVYAKDDHVFSFAPFEEGFTVSDYESGNYALYANTDNFLVVDGNGKAWDAIKSDFGTKTRRIAENALKQGYNGVIIKGIYDTGWDWNDALDEDTDLESDVYIFFDPQAQVKSADPVTYDDNGNVIPLSERFNPEQSDIRYSTKGGGLDALRKQYGEIEPGENPVRQAHVPRKTEKNKNVSQTVRTIIEAGATPDYIVPAIEEARQALKENDTEIRKLTAQLEKAKGQVKKTERPSLMKADVNRLAKKIIGDHASTLKASDIYAELDALAKTVMKKGVDDVTVSDLAHTLAEKITESAEVLVDDGMRDDYRGIKKYLRETPIAFNDKSDIPDWSIFHKRNIGRIRISQKGTGIDKVYIDLQERFGKALFPDDIDAPADQLLHFAELLDDLRDTYENPYDLDMAVAVEQTVNDILADIQTEQLRETPKTFADKANDKLKKAHSKAVAAKKEALKKVRADRDKKIADLKERHKESNEKARESRKAQELRSRITRHVADLSVKLRNPTDKQHIPERLRASVAKVLEAINLESAYSYDENGRRVKSREGVATKRTAAFAQLRKTYAEIAGDITVDPELVMAGGNLDIVLEMADTPIAEMTSAQLQTVWETLKAVETSIRTANKLFATERFETVSSLTEALRRDNKGKKAAAEILGWSALQRGVVLANESPETFFHLLGETGDYLFRMLRNAQDRQTVLTAAVKRFTHGESMAAIKDAKAWEKEIHTVKLGGEEVKMSAAQIMELYVLSHRKAAIDHILIGGILPENAKGKGFKIESRVNPVRGVTMEELLDVFKVLTAEQKDIANKLQKFASTTLSEWGNEASMKVYGYKKFNEPDYWTIRTNKQETKSTTESFTGTPSIANKGFTKTTKPHANNSLMIGSIFDTFANHASEMVNYAAYLDAMEDVGKVRNFVFFDVDGQRSGSVKEIVDTVHGKTGSQWLEKLLKDIAVGTKGLGGKNWYDTLFAKAKATAVGANLSVIVQQPTAIIRAMVEINPRYFVSGKSALKGWKKATEYAPIAQWKDWGYFDIRAGRQMKELFFDTDTTIDKITQLGMAPAGLMDSLSWGALWNAIENETKAKRTNLAPDTKEFYQAVAKRFTEIVEKTQVVDGVLQRSDMMRSDNAFSRMATAFMGEPTKQYNMVIRAFYDVKHAGKGGKAKAAKKMVVSSFVLLVSGVLNAAVKSLVGALRDDDKEKKYWEKWVDTFAGENLKEFGKSNLGGTLNPLAYIPVVKDVVSLVQGYDISRMDMALVEEAVKAATNMQKAMNDEGGKTIIGASVDMMVALSKLTGIPVGNIKRDVESVINTIANESDNYLLQYRMEKAVKSIDYSGNKKQFMAILYGAYTNDKEAYEIIYNDLVESGYNVESIRDAMEDRMKKDQGVKSVAELEQRWLPPTEQSNYDSGVKKLEASKLWKKATSKQKDSVEADLYNYLAGTKKGESIAEDISGGKAVGLTDTEYMLYQLALEMCDEPTESGKMGVINQSEAKKALDMLDELSDREKAYLWSITNSGWKSNPWD